MVEAHLQLWGNLARCVSIPERVLGWLKPLRLRFRLGLEVVSIPERVLGWLKQGFFNNRGDDENPVSIPERVLGWLKLALWKKWRNCNAFQSLKGFWVG